MKRYWRVLDRWIAAGSQNDLMLSGISQTWPKIPSNASHRSLPVPKRTLPTPTELLVGGLEPSDDVGPGP